MCLSFAMRDVFSLRSSLAASKPLVLAQSRSLPTRLSALWGLTLSPFSGTAGITTRRELAAGGEFWPSARVPKGTPFAAHFESHWAHHRQRGPAVSSLSKLVRHSFEQPQIPKPSSALNASDVSLHKPIWTASSLLDRSASEHGANTPGFLFRQSVEGPAPSVGCGLLFSESLELQTGTLVQQSRRAFSDFCPSRTVHLGLALPKTLLTQPARRLQSPSTGSSTETAAKAAAGAPPSTATPATGAPAAATEATAAAGAAAGAAAATSARTTQGAPRPRKRFSKRRVLGALALLSVLTGGALFSTSEPGVISEITFKFADLMTPFFRLLDPETAHELAVLSVSLGLGPKEHRPDPPSLACTVWGRDFPNPIGLAAGWDKDARAAEGVLNLGFGFTEIGSVTPAPQSGNPRPRIFRLPECRAVINRYGFNSEGIPAVAQRLGYFHSRRQAAELQGDVATGGGKSTHKGGKGSKAGSRAVAGKPEPPPLPGEEPDSASSSNPPASASAAFPPGLLGVNLGKNKWTTDAASDFVQGVYTLAQYADFLVINVSSPNTPGLRKLQGRRQLYDLIKKVMSARDEMQWGEKGPPPLLVKIAPDLSTQDMVDIAAVALSIPLDGLVVGNTTVSRPDPVLGLLHCEELGGLSGEPLFDLSTEVLRRMYFYTKGKIALVGCGGVFSGEDAYKKIRAGASLVQVYTGMIYEGPGLVPRVKKELAECLERDGFSNVAEAVGADHR